MIVDIREHTKNDTGGSVRKITNQWEQTASLTLHLQDPGSTVKSVYLVYFLWSAMSNCEALFIDTSISKYKFETANIVQDQINYVDTLKVLQ